jgi:hypothetical protein
VGLSFSGLQKLHLIDKSHGKITFSTYDPKTTCLALFIAGGFALNSECPWHLSVLPDVGV